MKLKAVAVVALVLLGLATGEAKAQSVKITIDTSVSKQITVNVALTNKAGWNKPTGAYVQLRPPGGAAGGGFAGNASATSMDGLNYSITFTKLTPGTKYDVQAVGTFTDNLRVPRLYYSPTSKTTVPP